MREQHLPEGGRANHSLGARENTGDGILLGQQLGAVIDLMDDAWWMPSVEHPMGATNTLVSARAIQATSTSQETGSGSTTRTRPKRTSSKKGPRACRYRTGARRTTGHEPERRT